MSTTFVECIQSAEVTVCFITLTTGKTCGFLRIMYKHVIPPRSGVGFADAVRNTAALGTYHRSRRVQTEIFLIEASKNVP